ncbi:ModD protein [Desulfosarcina ovata subsp. sediminis]|uniref:Putative pyrophosphorylase ModD n=1 Tax=Desulfosarcina ovata subsp. sediminis TaxID=885957 RepID=A0A5K7ZXA6_9BACT|nr:ModD protein [Desulfosarcina ovata]BBO84814.1 ModD protein [Desulfosarcina ovata subsp. sediminis]
MIYFTESEIDQLIEDDVPLGDMTTGMMNLSGKKAKITLLARNPMVACCTEEAVRLYRKVDLKVHHAVASGTELNPGDPLISAEGDAAAVHLVWRTGSALVEFASGVAGRTRQLVQNARAENAATTVAGTRKHPPYMKKVALKALMAGGGVPHRTGLSDTILIFKEHLLFTGGYDNLAETVMKMKAIQKERKIVVEGHTEAQAMAIVRSGADAVQVDKMTPEEFSACASVCRQANPGICMIAAGGINGTNAAAYAKAGADVLVSSWIYFAPPADVKAQITP